MTTGNKYRLSDLVRENPGLIDLHISFLYGLKWIFGWAVRVRVGVCGRARYALVVASSLCASTLSCAFRAYCALHFCFWSCVSYVLAAGVWQ
jgi:hypothetical protein